MALVWGVGETIAVEHLEAIRSYIEIIVGKTIRLDSGEIVKILKADIREKKSDSMLIYRYQLVTN
ncbi:hypothetical protein [Alkaliphilus transvaalensis]|uniref:hypothetical protein n=1 Tax=Alkaliphilus transvaalensis TaxID=114628 RepID=UPI00047B3961|nr:hypothetical protein [Alkaliphilus transvaalensis]